jgi:hypothetical protein
LFCSEYRKCYSIFAILILEWALFIIFTQGIDISEEEIKQSLRELKEKEERLQKDLSALEEKTKDSKQDIYGKIN